MLTQAFSTLALLTLVAAQATLTVPYATVTYLTDAPAGVSSAVSAAQSAYSSAKSEVQSDASAAASAFSSVRSQVNSYQSSLLADPSVRSLIDQVTNVLPTQRYTNLGALETFAVNAPDAFLAAYGPAISTASFYAALSAQESSINGENNVLRTAAGSDSAAATGPTTVAPSTVAATTLAATTVSGSVLPATTVAATTVAGVTAAANGASGPLATKAAMGVIGLAAGVVGIAMM